VPTKAHDSSSPLIKHISEDQQNVQKSRVTTKTANKNTNNERVSNKNDGSSRIEIRLHIQPGNNDINELSQLHTHLQELVEQLRHIDESITFIPWFERDNDTPLDGGKIPDDIRTINKYFPRLQPIKSGFTYGEARMVHKKRWEDIVHRMTDWLTRKKHGIYYQTLQCQSTTNLEWLLWSFRRIDVKCLEKEIESIYGIKIHLRNQNIATGQGKTSNEDMVRALHVVANQKEADKIGSLIQKIYSFQSETFPLGIVLRFVHHILRAKEDKNKDTKVEIKTEHLSYSNRKFTKTNGSNKLGNPRIGCRATWFWHIT
jgi:hypothetical protein